MDESQKPGILQKKLWRCFPTHLGGGGGADI